MPIKIVDHTPLIDSEGNISLANRVQGTLQFGAQWYKEMEAQAAILDRMKKYLNDRFTLLRNYTLPGPEVQFPFILIGPQGAQVIYICSAGGIFEARGDQWLELNPRKQVFAPAEPNPMRRAEMLSNSLSSFLAQYRPGVTVFPPVIFFSNAGIDIQTYDPSVRLVRLDALNRYLQTLLAEEGSLSAFDVSNVAKVFERAAKAREAAAQKQAQKPGGRSRKATAPKLKFSNTQWIFLGALALLSIIVFLILVALLFSGG